MSGEGGGGETKGVHQAAPRARSVVCLQATSRSKGPRSEVEARDTEGRARGLGEAAGDGKTKCVGPALNTAAGPQRRQWRGTVLGVQETGPGRGQSEHWPWERPLSYHETVGGKAFCKRTAAMYSWVSGSSSDKRVQWGDVFHFPNAPLSLPFC